MPPGPDDVWRRCHIGWLCRQTTAAARVSTVGGVAFAVERNSIVPHPVVRFRRSHAIRLLVVPATVALASVIGLRVVPPAAAGDGAPPSGAAALARYERQTLIWHGCRGEDGDETGATLDAAGAQCTEVTVPLDY